MTFRLCGWEAGEVSQIPHGAQSGFSPAVFGPVDGLSLTLLGRPSLVTQNDNTQRELVFFSLKKKKKKTSHSFFLSKD